MTKEKEPQEESPPEEILPETVTITKKVFDSLIADSEFLSALRACGVDNWEGYNDAVEINELSGE